MEARKIKLKLNQKIVLCIVVVAAFLSVALLVTEYLYYSNVLRQYAIKDGETWVQKLEDDLTGVYDEALRFARMASTNESVEQIVSSDSYAVPIEEYRAKRNANEALTKMMASSRYISSMAVVADGHVLVWTGNQFYDSLSETFSEAWYQEVIQEKVGESEGIAITNPYTYDIIRTKYHVISVSVPVYGYGTSEREIKIVVSVDVAMLKSILDEASEEFDVLAYVSDQGDILYTSNEDASEKLMSLWRKEQVSAVDQSLFFRWDTMLNGSICGFCRAPKVLASPMRDVLLLIIVALIVLFLMIGLMTPLLLTLTRPVGELTAAMEKVSQGDLKARASVESGDEFESLAQSLNDMIGKLETYLNESILSEREKSQLRFEVLAAQINPHFIYNTLNTVIYLTRKNQNEDVIKITNALIELLQDGVKLGDNQTFSTVKQELWVVKNYVLIQNYRYKDIITLRLKCDEELEDHQIPASVLQTIVENAIFHGIVPKGEAGTIWVNVMKENEKLVMMVSDNGVGMTEERIEEILSGKVNEKQESRNHIGIYNIVNRLKILYKDTFSFAIESEPDIGTTFVITIPDTAVAQDN